MKVSDKFLITLGASLLCLYGLIFAMFLLNVDVWKSNLSKEYLYKAKKESNVDQRLSYFELSSLLVPNQETYLGAGLAALEIQDQSLVEKYLPNVTSLNEWMQVADLLNVSRETIDTNRVEKLENILIGQGYPQSATQLLLVAGKEGALSRNGLIELANRQYEASNYEQSYSNLLKAKAIDPYYPQTFQQLVKVCEKLKKVDEAQAYQQFLLNLNF